MNKRSQTTSTLAQLHCDTKPRTPANYPTNKYSGSRYVSPQRSNSYRTSSSYSQRPLPSHGLGPLDYKGNKLDVYKAVARNGEFFEISDKLAAKQRAYKQPLYTNVQEKVREIEDISRPKMDDRQIAGIHTAVEKPRIISKSSTDQCLHLSRREAAETSPKINPLKGSLFELSKGKRFEADASRLTNGASDSKPLMYNGVGRKESLCGGTLQDLNNNQKSKNGGSEELGDRLEKLNTNGHSSGAKRGEQEVKNEMIKELNLSSRAGVVGLENLGNTCFMNSILQCLSNTKPLLEYCLQDLFRKEANKITSRMKGSMIKAYASLMESMWRTSQRSYISPIDLKHQISNLSRQFDGYRQHDAHEFLVYMLEGLHEDLNRVNEKKERYLDCSDQVETISASEKAEMSWLLYKRSDDSQIIDIFFGQLKSTLTCKECKYVSNTFEPFVTLSLPLNNSTTSLGHCFDLFSQEETMDRDNRPKCVRCKGPRICTKRFSIQRFPKILVIHLMKFKQGSTSKLNVAISCPVYNLDLSKFASDDRGSKSIVYNLFAVSNHSGTPISGHYTAAAKNPYTETWHFFNDSLTSTVNSPRFDSPEVYLLFYELKN